MNPRPPLAHTAAPPDLGSELAAVRSLMVTKLENKGYSREDAEDVAQIVVLRILENPAPYAEQLAAIKENEGFFVVVAFNEYLTQLRGEERRRRREEGQWVLARSEGEVVSGPGIEAVLAMAGEAGLTPLQRGYVEAVLLDRMFPEEIAKAMGTTERAVRAVLQRAAERLRLYLLRSSA